MMQRRGPAVRLTPTYTSDANADVSGGERTGGAYLQRIGLIVDGDLERLVGWHGATAHASVHAIAGNGLSGLRVGNILTVSGIEAAPALRLFNLWIEQKVGDTVTLRAGQFTAGQEFAISPTANLFVNSTFGWPGSFATDLPSGGPAYPLGAPGVRVAVAADSRTTVRAAVFSGDPAGRGDGDPQRRDLHGFNGWRLQGKPFVIAEVQRSAPGDDPAWTVTLGGWAHFNRFDDLRFDAMGVPLASPLSSGVPSTHAGNYAVYAMIDQRLWRPGARGFARISASPADRNAIDLYADAGVSLAPLFAARPDDVFGIGVAFARISPRLRSFIRDRASVEGRPLEAPGFEAVVEVSYQHKLGKSFYIQPNAQLIVHPAGQVIGNAAGFDTLPRRAMVIGLRTSLRL